MGAIEDLEKWKFGHKARSVEISHDNGFGASCWMVTLRSSTGTFPADWAKSANKDPVRAVYAAEVAFWTHSTAVPPNVVYATPEDAEDRAGLEVTIKAALECAERVGL